ncbi:MAG: hypothetical protein ACLTXT_03335 [Ruminococcus callidus]
MNGYEALLYLLRTAYSETEWRVTKPELPIRFLSGADDPCRGNDEKFAQAAQLLRQVGYQNVSSRLFPGMRHEILNETEKSLVYQDAGNAGCVAVQIGGIEMTIPKEIQENRIAWAKSDVQRDKG